MLERTQLHDLLLGFGVPVYYDPPESVKLRFPCIIYTHQGITTTYADNLPYTQFSVYQVMSVSRSADDPLVAELSRTPGFSFDRHYVSDNLHHNVFDVTHSYQP